MIAADDSTIGTSDLQLTNPQVNVSLDRERIAALGLTADQVESALFDAYGSRNVSNIFAPTNQYQVIMRVAPEFQRDAAAMSMLYVKSATGRLVPLSTVAHVESGVGPLQVNHVGQLPSVTLSFNLRPGASLVVTRAYSSTTVMAAFGQRRAASSTFSRSESRGVSSRT